MLLCELCRIEGYKVDVAHEGMHAISLAIARQTSVIVMSIGLPVSDGQKVVARRTRSQMHTKLRAQTGWGSQHDRELAAQAGRDRHLVKPIAFRTLRQQIDESLSRHCVETLKRLAARP